MAEKNEKDLLEKAKASEEEEDMENEGEMNDDEEEEEEKSCKKSEELSADDLEKSLEKLAEFVESNDSGERKNALLKKALDTGISDEENEELMSLMKGEKTGETFEEEMSKSMQPTDSMSKAFDASDYLADNHEEFVNVVTKLTGKIESMNKSGHDFNILLAKGVAHQGQAVVEMKKSLDSFMGMIEERLSSLEGKPARAPKSISSVPMAKSFAGENPNQKTLSKSEISHCLSSMIQKSCEVGQQGLVDGHNLIVEAAKFESEGKLSAPVIEMVKREISAGR